MADIQTAALRAETIEICAAWERLNDEQLAALARRDLEACALIQAQQNALLLQLGTIQACWVEAHGSPGSPPAVDGKPAKEVAAAGDAARAAADLEWEASWEAFLRAAQRVLASNRRNGRALAALIRLSGAVAPLASPHGVATYGHRGTLAAATAGNPQAIDCQG